MTGDDQDDDDGRDPARVVRFPYSRVRPVRGAVDDPHETYGALATQIGVARAQTSGHWCSSCRRIWYGIPLEVACPTCGNRHG